MATYLQMLLQVSTILIISATSVLSINCFQCSGTDSSQPFECNEFLDSDTNLYPVNCSNIYNALYCIKHVGRFEGSALECYQCDSTTEMECADGFMVLEGNPLESRPCDHVHNAQYCVKMTGGIATKRYCSSLDLGNYCNYVKQPGEVLTYRTCVYTCGSDGCNSAFRQGFEKLVISLCIIISVLAVKVYL